MSVSLLAWVAANPSAALNVLALLVLALAVWLLVVTQVRQRRENSQASFVVEASMRVNSVFYAVAAFAVVLSFGLSSYSASL